MKINDKTHRVVVRYPTGTRVIYGTKRKPNRTIMDKPASHAGYRGFPRIYR